MIDAVLSDDATDTRRWTGPGTSTGAGTVPEMGAVRHENGHNRRDTTPSALRIGDQPDRVLSAIARRVGALAGYPNRDRHRTAEVTPAGLILQG